MDHPIEIRRMVKAVEFATVYVDDETLEGIRSKSISLQELDDLMFDAECYTEVVDGDYPHEVAIIRDPDTPEFILFEDI